MIALSIFVAIARVGPVATSPVAACYRYQADTVTAQGRVVRRIYPGRPNYESVRNGDASDTVYVLRLARPICLASGATGQARAGVMEVQLTFSERDAPLVRAHNGRAVTVTGTFEEWTFGWHHLPVLLHVRGPHVQSAE